MSTLPRVKSMDKARTAFSTSKDIIQSINGFHFQTDTAIVLYATGRKFIHTGELDYVGKAYNEYNQILGDRYEFNRR